ncbi:MAG: anthranilate phosphoribosyltransferase, partial [Alphaproteobacteria bacterium]|nr:anthranilate phosphoribosyltransferase [Alphaproteobacteria bacterium]
QCLQEIGICFMLATRYHPSMRHISPIRQELGLRTVFNLLGPLANPARVKRQLLGVFSRDWTMPMAEVMKKLGTEKAWIVHGEDGMDEITTTGKTHVTALSRGHIQSFTINPEEFGIPLAEPQELQGRTATENAHAITRLLAGEGGPYRDIVMLNAAAALVVADRVGDITVGLQIAGEAIDSGAAADALAKLVMLTNA